MWGDIWVRDSTQVGGDCLEDMCCTQVLKDSSKLTWLLGRASINARSDRGFKPPLQEAMALRDGEFRSPVLLQPLPRHSGALGNDLLALHDEHEFGYPQSRPCLALGEHQYLKQLPAKVSSHLISPYPSSHISSSSMSPPPHVSHRALSWWWYE